MTEALTKEDEFDSCILVWLIRHKPTSNYIPEAYGHEGRGGSHLAPVPPRDAGKQRPRIFKSERAAKIFLTAWLKGKVVVDRYHGGADSDYDEFTRVVPISSRKRDEMEIVGYTIDLYTR